MCVGDVSTQPTGAPYPACASGLSTRSITPGALRALSACWRHVASNPARIEFVPITVIGLPLSPGAGMKPVASPVAWIWVGLVVLIANLSELPLGCPALMPNLSRLLSVIAGEVVAGKLTA